MTLSVHWDNSELNILDWDEEKLRSVAERGGVLYWNLSGMWGKVPNAVLVDAFSRLDEYRRLCSRRAWLVEADEWTIHWEQTVTPQDHRAASTAPLLPPSPQ